MKTRFLALLFALPILAAGWLGATTPASAQAWQENATRGASNWDVIRRDGMTPQTCRDFCRDRPGCSAWTWVRPRFESNGIPSCHLYRRAPRAQFSNCCITGVVRGGRPGGPGGGQAAFCRDYAQQAVEANRINQRRNCGYRGARWQSNGRNHFQWCMNVNRAAANRETRARQVQLQNCRGGNGRRGRTFNNPRIRGHIVDHCSTWATNCGQGGANLFCRTQGYQRASDFDRFRPGSTYVIGSRRVCRGRGCVGFRSVTCVGRR